MNVFGKKKPTSFLRNSLKTVENINLEVWQCCKLDFFGKKSLTQKEKPNENLSWGFTGYFSFFSFLLHTQKGTWIFGPDHCIVLEKLHKYWKFQVRYRKFVSSILWSSCAHQIDSNIYFSLIHQLVWCPRYVIFMWYDHKC